MTAGLLIVGSTLVGLGTADLVLRAVGYMPDVTHDWVLGSGARVANADLIMINPRFLPETFYDVDQGRQTIVTLGDSFTSGHPVGADNSYPSVLQRLLDERGWGTNVLNMGLGDSGPDQHLRLLKQYVLPRLIPDMVVWAFYANDVADNLRQAVYDIEDGVLVPLDATEHWLYIRQKFYQGIPLPWRVKASSPVLRLLFRALEIWGQRDIHLGDPSEQARSTAKIQLAIDELERLAQEYRFQVVYVLIAPQVLYLDDYDPTASVYWVNQYEQLRPIVGRQARFAGAWFGDESTQACGSEFTVPSTRAPASSSIFADGKRDKNPVGNRHFNEAGYYLLAELVTTCLMSEK